MLNFFHGIYFWDRAPGIHFASVFCEVHCLSFTEVYFAKFVFLLFDCAVIWAFWHLSAVLVYFLEIFGTEVGLDVS